MGHYQNKSDSQGSRVNGEHGVQCQERSELLRYGQQLHDAAIYALFSRLFGNIARVMFASGQKGDHHELTSKRGGRRRGWAA